MIVLWCFTAIYQYISSMNLFYPSIAYFNICVYHKDKYNTASNLIDLFIGCVNRV